MHSKNSIAWLMFAVAGCSVFLITLSMHQPSPATPPLRQPSPDTDHSRRLRGQQWRLRYLSSTSNPLVRPDSVEQLAARRLALTAPKTLLVALTSLVDNKGDELWLKAARGAVSDHPENECLQSIGRFENLQLAPFTTQRLFALQRIAASTSSASEDASNIGTDSAAAAHQGKYFMHLAVIFPDSLPAACSARLESLAEASDFLHLQAVSKTTGWEAFSLAPRALFKQHRLRASDTLITTRHPSDTVLANEYLAVLLDRAGALPNSSETTSDAAPSTMSGSDKPVDFVVSWTSGVRASASKALTVSQKLVSMGVNSIGLARIDRTGSCSTAKYCPTVFATGSMAKLKSKNPLVPVVLDSADRMFVHLSGSIVANVYKLRSDNTVQSLRERFPFTISASAKP